MTERARIEQDERDPERKGVRASQSGPTRPTELTPTSIAALQRSAGNHAVAGLMRQPAPPASRSRQRVLKRTEAGERTRTVAKVEVIGHASPRWRSAGNAELADARNRALSESRAQQVGWEVELLLAELLPDRQLVFEHVYQTSAEAPDALDDPADVTLDATSRGSAETLPEAGARGRQADDDPMRRVEVRVTLRSATETLVDEDTEHTERKSGATKDWALSLQAEAGLEFGVKGGGVLVLLRNNLTDTVGTYAGEPSAAVWAPGSRSSRRNRRASSRCGCRRR